MKQQNDQTKHCRLVHFYYVFEFMKFVIPFILLKTVVSISVFGAFNTYNEVLNTYTLGQSTDVNLTGGSGNFYFDFTGGGDLPDSIQDTKLIISTSKTYTFTHVGTGHPFVVLSDTQMAPYNPNDPTPGLRDSFPSNRTASDAYVAASNSESLFLNITDSFTWTPTAAEIGDYWYTCGIAGHRDFLGEIEVVAVPESSNFALILGGLAIGLVVLRRR